VSAQSGQSRERLLDALLGQRDERPDEDKAPSGDEAELNCSRFGSQECLQQKSSSSAGHLTARLNPKSCPMKADM
jgi:hypothetical protein